MTNTMVSHQGGERTNAAENAVPVGKEEHRRLKAAGLVEGRYPSVIVAGAVARAAGEAGRHIRERGFDKQYYLDLIQALVREHQPADRRDVDQLLLTKLPDRLSPEQKRRKVQNLLQELRRCGVIENRGTRSRPQWVAVEPPLEDGSSLRGRSLSASTPREPRLALPVLSARFDPHTPLRRVRSRRDWRLLKD